MFLQYYAQENQRHPVAKAAVTSFENCQAMAVTLFNHFGVPPISVKLVAPKSRVKRIKSWFSPRALEIVLHPKMLTALTVAHEVAHYVHHLQVKERRQARPSMPREKWHGPQHRRLTDEALKVLAERIRFRGLMAKGGAAALETFMASLPATATCPRCRHSKPKEAFGLRIMARDQHGTPTSIRRQSYCKPCRAKPPRQPRK